MLATPRDRYWRPHGGKERCYEGNGYTSGSFTSGEVCLARPYDRANPVVLFSYGGSLTADDSTLYGVSKPYSSESGKTRECQREALIAPVPMTASVDETYTTVAFSNRANSSRANQINCMHSWMHGLRSREATWE